MSDSKPRLKNQALTPVGTEGAARLADWRKLWMGFLKAHPGWYSSMNEEHGVYLIPEPIIKELAAPQRSHRASAALLNKTEADTERAFHEMCNKFSPYMIGVWQGSPLIFPLLAPLWPGPAEDD